MNQPTDPATPPPADDADATASQPPADPRELMRIALEKKNQRSKAGAAHLDGHAKAGGTHGKAGGSRQFRRKSGG